MPQSQTATLPRPQEEEETDKSKQAQTEQTHEKHQDQRPPPPFPPRLPPKGLKNTRTSLPLHHLFINVGLCLSVCHFVLVFFSPFSIAITSLGEERANLSAFRTFVRFVLV